MITRIKMNILLFVFLVIFEIVISGTTKQSEAQETIIIGSCLLYTSPSPRDRQKCRIPSSA